MKNIIFLFTILLFVSCNSSQEKNNTSSEVPKQVQSNKVFPKLEPNRYNVAFLIMDGTYNTELTAPYDIFQHTILKIA